MQSGVRRTVQGFVEKCIHFVAIAIIGAKFWWESHGYFLGIFDATIQKCGDCIKIFNLPIAEYSQCHEYTC